MVTPIPLTEAAIRNAKPGLQQRKLYDERGLYLLVSPKGGKWWRFKYRFENKEKLLSLGTYPEVGLKDARERREKARKLVAQSIDPSTHRRAQAASRQESSANSFEVVAREWLSKQQQIWSEVHFGNVISRLEGNVLPWLGKRPVADINAQELLKVIRRIEERGAVETAHRTLSICGQTFRYAVATARTERDVAADLKGALQPVRPKHLAAITEPKRVGELLREIDGYEGTLAVKCALRLSPLVFIRPGELRNAKWSDIDLGKAEWRFEASKTKSQHIVPLATQAIAIFKELQPLTGKREYVFPNGRSPLRPMSNNAVLSALRRMGIPKEEMSGHGFRAMARTILDEELGFRPDFIEHQLAHAVSGPLGRAYNRTSHLDERKKMMQAWADYLDRLRCRIEKPS